MAAQKPIYAAIAGLRGREALHLLARRMLLRRSPARRGPYPMSLSPARVSSPSNGARASGPPGTTATAQRCPPIPLPRLQVPSSVSARNQQDISQLSGRISARVRAATGNLGPQPTRHGPPVIRPARSARDQYGVKPPRVAKWVDQWRNGTVRADDAGRRASLSVPRLRRRRIQRIPRRALRGRSP